jgi:hypothetical protein
LQLKEKGIQQIENKTGRVRGRLSSQTRTLFFVQEIVRLDTGLSQNGPQRAFRQVSGMVGDGGVAIGLGIVPDLVASGRLTVKGKAERLETFDDLAVFKTR